MTTPKLELLTLGEVAERLHCQVWQVARVFDRALLPKPARVGRNRVVSPEDLPAIKRALCEAGFLKQRGHL